MQVVVCHVQQPYKCNYVPPLLIKKTANWFGRKKKSSNWTVVNCPLRPGVTINFKLAAYPVCHICNINPVIFQLKGKVFLC